MMSATKMNPTDARSGMIPVAATSIAAAASCPRRALICGRPEICPVRKPRPARRSTSCPADHCAVSFVRGQLAGILDAQGRREEARELEVVRPGIKSKAEGDVLLQLVEAEALLLLGKRQEAIEAGRCSLTASKNDAQRQRIYGKLSELGLIPDK
jgi:hypothetical protein